MDWTTLAVVGAIACGLSLIGLRGDRKMPPEKRPGSLGWTLVAVFLFVVLGWLFDGFDSASVRAAKSAAREIDLNRSGAYAYMQEFVLQRLKAPASAKFPPNNDQYVTYLGKNRYRVVAFVDAQNSFGATLRAPFQGELERIDGGWRLISLHIETVE